MERIFHPTGRDPLNPVGGEGAFTGRFIRIVHSRPGSQYTTAFTVTHEPPADTDDDIPTAQILSGAKHLGPTIQLSRLESGNLLLMDYAGSEKLSVDQDGDLDSAGFLYTQKYLQLLEQAADPPTSVSDIAQIWVSDGTDTGDAGDGYVQVHQGGDPGTDKIIHLWDFSTGAIPGAVCNLTVDDDDNIHSNISDEGSGLTTGGDNVLLGYDAGAAITAGGHNIALGSSTLMSLTGYSTNDENVAICNSALWSLLSGSDNIAIGESAAGGLETDCSGNIAIGHDALYGDNSPEDVLNNIAIGPSCLSNVETDATHNYGIGTYCLNNIESGEHNLGWGNYAGSTLTVDSSYNICIGPGSGPATGTEQSNKLYIDIHSTNDPLIQGDFNAHTIDINGTFSKTAGSFKINHPLFDNKWLYHGFVESPEYGLLYRGAVDLVKGKAIIDIDKASGMTSGIYKAIAMNATVYLQNLSGFTPVRCGDIIDGKFEITAQNSASKDKISWLVCAERADPFVMESAATDGAGHLLLERVK